MFNLTSSQFGPSRVLAGSASSPTSTSAFFRAGVSSYAVLSSGADWDVCFLGPCYSYTAFATEVRYGELAGERAYVAGP